MVVFDFDKTLTNEDTLWGFYKEVDSSNLFFSFKRGIILFFAILHKVKIINNTVLKKIGVRLFLKGKSRDYLLKKAITYTQKIPLNNIYSIHFLSVPKEKRLIISASFDVYLSILFLGERVIGSSLYFEKGKVLGLEKNMYGEQKKLVLKENGIETIEALYTDSYSDKPLMEIANCINIVKNGTIVTRTK
ncbi:HAD family hydrolase [Phaeodactylibacter xiamenensis]|uniref:HAD family hydrolase n=1 Tax=Phaeodactylibacter xiamenensis TaxID=1524460 RepID=UPI003BA977C5